MPSFRAPDERRLPRRFLDLAATAWGIAVLAAIGLDVLHAVKPIKID